METKLANPQSNQHKVTWRDIYRRIEKLPKDKKFFGIPRGGSIIAGLTGKAVDTVEECDIILDDIYDSGHTAIKWERETGKKVEVLFDKREQYRNTWLVMPWEGSWLNDAEEDVVRFLQRLGEDPDREGLRGTPRRVVKAFDYLLSGYKDTLDNQITVFDAEGYNEMIILKDIDFYSLCEHHLLPFYGKGHIAYIPGEKILGISKLARVLDHFSRRLQNQERLAQQVVEYLQNKIKPKGASVILEGRHLCMTARGVEKQKTTMITSALRGSFHRDNVKQEMLKLLGGR